MKLSVTPYTFHQEFYRGEMDVFHLIETIKCRYHLNAVDMWNFTGRTPRLRKSWVLSR